ncbi:MAG: DRTGG domain-containing protein [Bacillota bacterium]
MKISEIIKLLNGRCLLGEDLLDHEVEMGFGCDLMSDVLAFTQGKTLLLTGLSNTQVVRTAEMLDINAIVFVRGKYPTPEVVALAKDNNMMLATTNYTMFTACGILYASGLKGIPNDEVMNQL